MQPLGKETSRGVEQTAPQLFPSTCFIFYYRYVLEKVDLVIVGAEGVVESGGIINKVRFSEHLFVAEVI